MQTAIVGTRIAGLQAAGPRNALATIKHDCLSTQTALTRQQGTHLAAKAPLRAVQHAVATVHVARPTAVAEADPVSTAVGDNWIGRYLEILPQTPPSNIPKELASLQSACQEALHTARMPTTRNEEFKFTDLSVLLQGNLQASGAPSPAQLTAAEQLMDARSTAEVVHLMMLDGRFRPDLSRNMELLPEKMVYVGHASQAPSQALEKLGSQTQSRGGIFATLNGAASTEALCVIVSDNIEVEPLIHVVHASSSGPSAEQRTVSTPRLYIAAGKSAKVTVVEEYLSMAAASGECAAFVNAVTEIHAADKAEVGLDYVNLEATGSLHFHTTLVQQEESSSFRLTEGRLGGTLTRHDIHIVQQGPDTNTEMRSFLLAGQKQLHDLHSKLRMTKPRGQALQLHKCIVANSTGRGVFDGNVRVEKLAQQTDAKQLSRNLLLAPKATVNVKPNLQIIADDVKCTHGCTVSDLEEEQMFYFLSRGINASQARQTLVYSFGAEVVAFLACKSLARRFESAVKQALVAAMPQ